MAKKKATLVFPEPDGDEKKFEIEKSLYLGRAINDIEGCENQLIIWGDEEREGLEKIGFCDSGISRKHAKLYWEEDKLYIEDLGSANGTLVDGAWLVPREPKEIDGSKWINLGLYTRAYLTFDGGKPKYDGTELDHEKVEKLRKGVENLLILHDVRYSINNSNIENDEVIRKQLVGKIFNLSNFIKDMKSVFNINSQEGTLINIKELLNTIDLLKVESDNIPHQINAMRDIETNINIVIQELEREFMNNLRSPQIVQDNE